LTAELHNKFFPEKFMKRGVAAQKSIRWKAVRLETEGLKLRWKRWFALQRSELSDKL